VYCAIAVEKYCNSGGSAGGERQKRDDSLVHKSFEVNEYLVEANARFTSDAQTETRKEA